MIQTRQVGKMTWVDLTSPTPEEIDQLIAQHELPQSLVQSSLDPEHLPQLETENGWQVLVIRTYDASAIQEDDTIQNVTRKTSLIMKGDLLITLHRAPLSCLQSHFDVAQAPTKLIPELIAKMLKTYETAIRQIYETFETLEEEILEPSHPTRTSIIQDLYLLKRRVTLLKRLLRMTQEPLMELSSKMALHQARDYLEKFLFQLEEVSDNLIGILSLQVSIAGQKSNEIMRVLTVYSILFMPLNLIAGIYGMNFEHMPELKWVQGYPAALGVMATVGVSILLWFRSRGWLKANDR